MITKNTNNILITGITSIHGWPIYLKFKERYGKAVYGISTESMSRFFKGDKNVFSNNMEKLSAVEEIFNKVQPKAIVHAGGVCDLDRCEREPDFAHEVNVIGAQNIVNLSKDIYLLYISTDLVFSGNTPLDNRYSESSRCDPVSVIGRTFVKAEKAVLDHDTSGIIRLGLPIGPSVSGTKGPIDFIAKRLSTKRKMTLFHDEVRSLITTEDLAHGVLNFFEKKGKGVFHYGGPKEYSLYDIGSHLVKTRGYKKEYLIRSSRFDEVNGPPRIGRVILDSKKFYDFTGFTPSDALRPDRNSKYNDF
ncbi:MAG: sugar nucleotide-binding protein [Candidatus Omnitrophota bacterium]